MIRILHVIGTMNRGGAETLIMEIYRNIDRTKIQFDFFVYNYSDAPGAYDEEILSMGGKIFLAQKRFYQSPPAFMKELREFFSSHPEYKIVHSHLNFISGYISKAAKSAGINIIIAHSHVAHQKTDWLHRCIFRYGKVLIKKNADYVFGCSEDALKTLVGKSSDGSTHFVINNAINIDKFSFSQEQRKNWRNQLGVNSETFVIGNVASFTYPKNHEHLVRTFAEVVKIRNNSMLILIGTGSKEQEIKDLAKSLSIEDKIIFMGSRSDVNDIINAFDVFVMPSHYEGLGIVLIEAQANGLPCIISADVIPDESDMKCGMVTRVSLNEDSSVWAQTCLDAKERIDSNVASQAIDKAGFNIKLVANWIQNFYLTNWK